MAIFIPHRCPKCFESVTLIQPLDKQDMPKGKAQGHCVFCGWKEEIEIYPKDDAIFEKIELAVCCLTRESLSIKDRILEAAFEVSTFIGAKYQPEDQKIRDLWNEIVNSLTSGGNVKTTVTAMDQAKLSGIEDSFKRLHQLAKAWKEETHND